MVVKDRIGRKRYILFSTGGQKKAEIIKVIKNKAYLVFYNKKYGIVRCKHTEKENIIKFLSSTGFKTIKTSGTIKTLKEVIKNN
ncbi:MAG: hypothetical protein J7J36_01170 [Thermoplasmata archaeon]|nr:hypothetical protein [Thermoplasmata archaeon]